MEIETAVNAKMAVNKGTGGVNISIGADGHWYYHKQMQILLCLCNSYTPIIYNKRYLL